MHPETVVRGTRLDLAAVEPGPLTHPHQAPAAVRLVTVLPGSAPEVDDVYDHLVRGGHDTGPDGRGACVPQGVGQRLLEDAVRREVDPRGQLLGIPLQGELDGESRGGQLADQQVRVTQPRARNAGRFGRVRAPWRRCPRRVRTAGRAAR